MCDHSTFSLVLRSVRFSGVSSSELTKSSSFSSCGVCRACPRDTRHDSRLAVTISHCNTERGSAIEFAFFTNASQVPGLTAKCTPPLNRVSIDEPVPNAP